MPEAFHYESNAIFVKPTVEIWIISHYEHMKINNIPKVKSNRNDYLSMLIDNEINGKSYAKTIFLIGLENDNYNENLEFTTKINDKLNEKYPNLSKGIYKKGGEGVNGVYNQDNSKYTILLEIGGPENNTTEVLNSTLAFADCFMEVISTNEG